MPEAHAQMPVAPLRVSQIDASRGKDMCARIGLGIMIAIFVPLLLFVAITSLSGKYGETFSAGNNALVISNTGKYVILV